MFCNFDTDFYQHKLDKIESDYYQVNEIKKYQPPKKKNKSNKPLRIKPDWKR